RLNSAWPGQLVIFRLLANRLLSGRLPQATDGAVELERLLLLELLAIAHRRGIPVVMAVVGDAPECVRSNAGAADPHDVNPRRPFPAYVAIRALVRTLDTPSLDLCHVAPRTAAYIPIDG